MSLVRWCIRPVDTWFFREARAHDAVGVGALRSMFPPPLATLAGAIRTTWGDALGVNWAEWMQRSESHPMLGDAEQMGQLRIRHLQLVVNEQPLYPLPQDVLLTASEPPALERLVIADPIQCDLGYVAMAKATPGSKPLDESWLTHAGLTQWLQGQTPSLEAVQSSTEFMSPEMRLGIGRDVAHGTVKTGLLYQTQHLRAREDLSLVLEVYIEYPDSADPLPLPSATSMRLGGEGRSAAVTLDATPPSLPEAPSAQALAEHGRFCLLLNSPAQFNPDDMALGWCLPGFQPVHDPERNATTHWEGELAGIPLRILSCVLQRPLRVGGWDQKQRRPKALHTLTAPGSVYYCELANTDPDHALTQMQDLLERVHGWHFGAQTDFGYGQLLVGLWPAHSTPVLLSAKENLS